MKKLLLSFLVLAVGSTLLKADDIETYSQRKFQPFSTKDINEELVLTLKDLPHFADSSNSLQFHDILSKSDESLFSFNEKYSPSQFVENSNYWIRLDFLFEGKADKYWLLEFYDQTTDKIIVYKPLFAQDSGSLHPSEFSLIELGDSKYFGNRLFRHKNFEVFINPSSPGYYTYYINIQSHRFADIRLALRSFNRFVNRSLTEYLLYGFMYGMILIISIYNLLMYMVIREKKYLYYIFYILSVGLYAMCVDGIAFQYLWPNNPDWNEIAYGVFLYLIVLFALLFTEKFLITRQLLPKFHRAILWIIALRTILFLIGLAIDPQLFDHRTTDILIFAFIFFAGIMAWKKGYQPARYFIIAYGVLFVGFCVKALVMWGDIPFNTPLHYSLRIAFLIEMILLSFALADRVRILKKNRDDALQKMLQEQKEHLEMKEALTKSLEQKVIKRTRQLQEKNQLLEASYSKLKEQSSEIYTINNLLDLENWKLKNKLKSVVKGRMLKSKLTFEEFSTVFPNDDICLKQVAHMKWNSDYKCRRCENKKYSDGTKKYSRRCSKCGYNESATAFTLFHGIKFSIVKAFYILYVVLNNEDYITLEELSKTLDLQKNTVWNFKKKVNEFLHNEEELGHIHAWKDVMVDLEVLDSNQ